MKNEFVPYEEALALKELGCVVVKPFKEYDTLGILQQVGLLESQQLESIPAPLYQQAFRWFREKYGLWFRPDYYDETRTDFSGSIHKLGRYSAIASIEECKSAEEAELACLRKLIDLITQNKEDER
tara:strand:+ start:10476 stop:10853 length:378 start_codon:yes stop_codon:yes gene_type:complete